jgi:hypothetical protein
MLRLPVLTILQQISQENIMGILNRALLAGALAVAAVAMAAPLQPAAAIPTLALRLSDGTTTVTQTDSLHTGVITYSGALGNFTVNVTTGIDEYQLGVTSQPSIDLNSINVSGTGGTLTIWLTEYDIPNTAPVAGFGTLIGGTLTNATLTLNTFIDPSSLPFGTATQISTRTFTPGAFSGTAGQSSLYTGELYSMTERVTITATGRSSVSFDAALRVPEPASIAVLGFGLAGLGAAMGWVRRRDAGPCAG